MMCLMWFEQDLLQRSLRQYSVALSNVWWIAVWSSSTDFTSFVPSYLFYWSHHTELLNDLTSEGFCLPLLAPTGSDKSSGGHGSAEGVPGPLEQGNDSHTPNPCLHRGALSSSESWLGDATWNTKGIGGDRTAVSMGPSFLCADVYCAEEDFLSCPGALGARLCRQASWAPGAAGQVSRGVWGPDSQQLRDAVLSPPRQWVGGWGERCLPFKTKLILSNSSSLFFFLKPSPRKDVYF